MKGKNGLKSRILALGTAAALVCANFSAVAGAEELILDEALYVETESSEPAGQAGQAAEEWDDGMISIDFVEELPANTPETDPAPAEESIAPETEAPAPLREGSAPETEAPALEAPVEAADTAAPAEQEAAAEESEAPVEEAEPVIEFLEEQADAGSEEAQAAEEKPEELPGEAEELPAEPELLEAETEFLEAIEEESFVMEAETLEEASLAADAGNTVTVALTGDALANFDALENALMQADGINTLTVKIAAAGNYPLDTPGRALGIRSNTVVDLNGATLTRTGGMRGQNIFQNGEPDPDFYNRITKKEKGGYSLSANITIKNGTLDGGSGFVKDNVAPANVVNLGHATNVTITGVNFRNCYGGHLVELTGCKDCLIDNCTFDGFTARPGETLGDEAGNESGEGGEAIQLDICNNEVGTETWNNAYKNSDSTVCQNITVQNCTFKNYPSGVGNHHTLYGKHSSNIRILNNTFSNSTSASVPAVWCYGFDNSVVSGNTITGNYTSGIQVSGGSVTVTGNKVVMASANAAIYVTEANSHKEGYKETRGEETVTGGLIEGNTVTQNGTLETAHAVSVYSGSVLSSVSSNILSAAAGDAVIVSGAGSKVDAIRANTITAAGSVGIHVGEQAKVGTVADMTIPAGLCGIQVGSGASVGTISGCTVSAGASDGILVTGSGSSVTEISGNQINVTGKEGIGIHVGDQAQIGSLNNNTPINTVSSGVMVGTGASVGSLTGSVITSSGAGGIVMTGAGTKCTTVSGNTVKAAADGVSVGDGAKVDTVSGIGISAGGTGISIASGSVVKTVSGCTVSAGSGDGILVSGSGTSVTEISGNQITKAGQIGIHVGEKAKISSLTKNTPVNSASTGVMIGTGASVGTFTGSVITSGKAGGILVTGSGSKCTTISGHTVKAAAKQTGVSVADKASVGTVSGLSIAKCGISVQVTSGASLGKLSGCTLTASTGDSILVSGKGTSVTEISGCKVSKAGAIGIHVGEKAKIGKLSKNTPINSVSQGVMIGSGAVVTTLTGSKITSSKSDGILVTGSGSTCKTITSTTVTANSGSGVLVAASASVTTFTKNTVTSKNVAVQVSSKGKITTLGAKDKANTITSTAGNGITVTGSGSSVGKIDYNTITATKGSKAYGIAVASSAKVTTEILSNKVTAKKSAIYVASKGTIKALKSNTLTTKSEHGVFITGAGSKADTIASNKVASGALSGIYVTGGTVGTVQKNTLPGCKQNGIALLSAAKATKVIGNTITKPGKYGIYVSSKAKVANIQSNVIKDGKKEGIYITASTVSGAVSKNQISGCKSHGISVTSSGTAKKITDNTVTGCKGYGIYYMNKTAKMTVSGNKLSKNSKGALLVKGSGTIQKK